VCTYVLCVCVVVFVGQHERQEGELNKIAVHLVFSLIVVLFGVCVLVMHIYIYLIVGGVGGLLLLL